ncbi:MAG TPA: S28 family serine protease [Parafilimonas sp.]|nr:S28 family serine protease [Parafilimonas sp.]
MKSLFVFFFFFCLSQLRAQSDELALERALYDLPGVQFKKISNPGDKYLRYALQIKQPLDHQHPEDGYFYQSAVLIHKGFERPVVMETEGYELYPGEDEIADILNANDIDIEFRYFGQSRPETLQWQYLTFAQACADLHHVNELLKTIYSGKFVSTGISRGGQTSIYYKYYYPDDVNVTIPYVAPLPNSLEDKRIYKFLDTMGSQECRDRIFNFQKFMLTHENEMLEKLKWYEKGTGETYNYFGGLGGVFEIAVLEYPFSFWQTGFTPCEQIPVNASVDVYLDHFLKISPIDWMSDKGLAQLVVHNYMARTEMGYYGYDITRFKTYLHYISGQNPSAALAPKYLSYAPFDTTFTHNVHAWLNEKGNNMLYIYGGRDTWSACRVIVSNRVNSKSFMIPGANHFQARVRNMPPDMRKDFAASLQQLLNVEVDLDALK